MIILNEYKYRDEVLEGSVRLVDTEDISGGLSSGFKLTGDHIKIDNVPMTEGRLWYCYDTSIHNTPLECFLYMTCHDNEMYIFEITGNVFEADCQIKAFLETGMTLFESLKTTESFINL